MNPGELQAYLSIGAMILMGVTVASVISLIAAFSGPRNPNPRKVAPYECGIEEVVPLPKRFPVKFLQIAMLFLIFDVEAIALYPAASILKGASAAGYGLYLLMVLGIFMALIVLGFFYEWKKGAFDWIS